MKERPILFNAEMVRAVLDGRKTQTRRVMNITDTGRVKEPKSPRNYHLDDPHAVLACPYGQPGDKLWVRETHSIRIKPEESTDGIGRVWYYATSEDQGITKWKPSIHMPRWASRINLEITRVRVERLQDISEEDALAEGIRKTGDGAFHVDDDLCRAPTARECYARLWESINGPESWNANPWVWVIEFKKIA